ncbi:hypothetical protein BDFB_013184, partial [Asbolus verrucosus]
SDDCFIVLRKIFFDYGYHRYTKLFNKICLFFHSVVYLFQIYYMVNHFNRELFYTMSLQMIIFVFILATMVSSIYFEDDIALLLDLFITSSWSIESAGVETQNLIIKKSRTINIFNYAALSLFAFSATILLPVFGDVSELFLCIRVFDEYFGVWSKIPNLFYFSTLHFMFYSAIRLGYLFLYGILNIQIQIVILGEHILQISNDYDDVDEWQKLYNTAYQKEMYKRLRFCIKQHATLKICITKLLTTVTSVMFIFVVLGISATADTIFFMFCNLKNQDNLLKLRLLSIAFCNGFVVFLFCEGGEGLIDEVFSQTQDFISISSTFLQTGHIFNNLMDCPWYLWNTKNRLLLLTFMTNCLQPLKFSVAGIALNRQLAASITKVSLSFANVLYNLKQF